MSCEIDCEQIYPLKRPAICGLCKTVPKAREDICEARREIIKAIETEFKKRNGSKNIRNMELWEVLRRRNIIAGSSNSLKTIPAIEEAMDSGILVPSRIGHCLRSLIISTWKDLTDRCSYGSGNNGSRSLATFIENSHRFLAPGKRAPLSD